MDTVLPAYFPEAEAILMSVATPVVDSFCHFMEVTADVELIVAVKMMLPPKRTVDPPDKIITGGAAMKKKVSNYTYCLLFALFCNFRI